MNQSTETPWAYEWFLLDRRHVCPARKRPHSAGNSSLALTEPRRICFPTRLRGKSSAISACHVLDFATIFRP